MGKMAFSVVLSNYLVVLTVCIGEK